MLANREEKALRQFCGVVGDIHDCRFIRKVKVQDHTISISCDPSKNRIPEYDRDDFRSFATLFRKLIANRESTQLFRIMKILKRFAPEDKKSSFKGIKAIIRQEAERPALAIAIGQPGSELTYTPKKICDIFFNGMVFHSDPELQDDLARILDFEPIIIVAFLRYATTVLNVATKYSSLIKHHNYFVSEIPSADP